MRFVDDGEMTHLNQTYLGREGSTNVMAFPMTEPEPLTGEDAPFDSPMLGDVVICVDEAAREAHHIGEPVAETLDRLLIHGVLHLMGFDHETSAADAGQMGAAEERLMSLIKEE